MYALITGASSGIGTAFSRHLANMGYDLILVARRSDRLNSLEHELKQQYNIAIEIICCDLSKREDCYQLIEKVSPLPIEVVINNAGFGVAGTLMTVPLNRDLDMIHTNISAVHILTKEFAKQMDHGYILNVASIAGTVPTPAMSTYGATKSYVLHLSQSTHYEMKRLHKPITISVLCPGPVNTEFNQVAGVQNAYNGISAEYCANIGLKGLFRKKRIIIPTWQTKLLYIGCKILPMRLLLPIEYHLQTKKLQ